GMDDRFESLVSVDTDNDGVPEYLDLDSDHVGLMDVDESGTRNAKDLLFENGDGDITGGGVGDGSEHEHCRDKDSNGDGIVEGYGHGILDIYDFNDGNTSFANSYGNSGQSILRDSDGDGIADYRDPFNNTTGIYDIDTVEIYKHLPNTNGILNSTMD